MMKTPKMLPITLNFKPDIIILVLSISSIIIPCNCGPDALTSCPKDLKAQLIVLGILVATSLLPI